MSDPKKLLAEATPLPWAGWTNGFDAGIVSDADGRDPKDRYRPLIFGGEPNEGWIDPEDPDVELVVHAVNHLPDYLAAVEALEAMVRFTDPAYAGGSAIYEARAAAREVLRRLRGEL